MIGKTLNLQEQLKGCLGCGEENPIEEYALESFARQVDDTIQKELLTRLILDHSSIAREMEDLYNNLSRSEAALKEAQKIAMLGRWDLNLKTGELIWSDSMFDILEIARSAGPSIDGILSRVHPEDGDMVRKLTDDLAEKKEPWSMDYRLLMEDGRVKWIHLSHNPVLDEKGDVVQCYGTIQDISELKETELELERYSKHLEDLVNEKVREISDSQLATIFALVKLSESRDDDTGEHIERTATFCRLLGEKALESGYFTKEINGEFLETIYKASPLHDIGKVGIPDNILLKPGRLTEEEFAVMKTHVGIGYQTLSKIQLEYSRNGFLKMGMDIALCHHEKWNGTGYPRGIQAEEIPLSARIMAIADVYDALRSKRVYKEAFSHEKSVSIIREGRGAHFDPDLTDTFLKWNETFRELYDDMH